MPRRLRPSNSTIMKKLERIGKCSEEGCRMRPMGTLPYCSIHGEFIERQEVEIKEGSLVKIWCNETYLYFIIEKIFKDEYSIFYVANLSEYLHLI